MERNDMPLASLLVAFYNQEQFVQDTVKGALAQTYSNLEIIFSDDCSTDGTFNAIKDAIKDYKGPHRVVLNRNEKNMGLIPHVNKELFELSHGDYICLAGGDDVSLPERVSDAVALFEDNPNLQAIAFSCKRIDKNGNPIGESSTSRDIIYERNSGNYLKSCDMVTPGFGLSFRREMLNRFGPLDIDCQTEDSTIRFRCLLMGSVLYTKKYGILYRIHDDNISAPSRIYKLRTDKIANQFKKDLECIKNDLSKKDYELLNDKIEFYIKNRYLSETIAKSKFYIVKVGLYIVRKFLQIRYVKKISSRI